ncbi:MAG: precorrin-3B C(17)-methyltransferase [Thermoleophilia bacterium]
MKQDSPTTSYFSLTAGGALLALKLRDRFGGDAHLPRCHSLGCGHCDPFDSIAEALPERFLAGDTLVCVMAAGIPFRVLAPHLRSKQEDPAVIVIDEAGRHVVPLLGGHAAGANRIALDIAEFLGGDAVITTASDVQGLVAPDEVARRLGLIIDDPVALRRVTAMLVDGKQVCIESSADPGIEGYDWVPAGGDTSAYAGRILITEHISDEADDSSPAGGKSENASRPSPETVHLVPRTIVAGVGCRRDASADEIVAAIAGACVRNGMDLRAVGALASIDVKSDEAGLIEAAARLDAGLRFFTAAELAAEGRPGSKFVDAKVGTPAVCEPAALLAAGAGELLSGKEASGPVTVALAVAAAGLPCSNAGRVIVVGTGAGTDSLLTAAAKEALAAADIVMGYRTYVEQIRDIFPGKQFITGSMGAEVDRCRQALAAAADGQTVAMISSGDPGVYGMAGPLLELSGGTPVEIVPGVTAAQIAAARLGAPLMNDYVTLSLSDLLTPREEVLRRLRLAADSDLVICLYNPTSKKRRPLFEEVCGILASSRPADTPVGWVRAAGSPEESFGVTDITSLIGQDIDMRTIVIVGNSRTAVINGRMVTGRGYENKRAGREGVSQ